MKILSFHLEHSDPQDLMKFAILVSTTIAEVVAKLALTIPLPFDEKLYSIVWEGTILEGDKSFEEYGIPDGVVLEVKCRNTVMVTPLHDACIGNKIKELNMFIDQFVETLVVTLNYHFHILIKT